MKTPSPRGCVRDTTFDLVGKERLRHVPHWSWDDKAKKVIVSAEEQAKRLLAKLLGARA